MRETYLICRRFGRVQAYFADLSLTMTGTIRCPRAALTKASVVASAPGELYHQSRKLQL